METQTATTKANAVVTGTKTKTATGAPTATAAEAHDDSEALRGRGFWPACTSLCQAPQGSRKDLLFHRLISPSNILPDGASGGCERRSGMRTGAKTLRNVGGIITLAAAGIAGPYVFVATGSTWTGAGIVKPHVSWAQAPPGQPQASTNTTFRGRRHHTASPRHPRTPRPLGAGTTRPAAGSPEAHVSWPQAPQGHPQASPKSMSRARRQHTASTPTFCGRRHHPACRDHPASPRHRQNTRFVNAGITRAAPGITQGVPDIAEPHVSWVPASHGQPQASPNPTFRGRRHHTASRRHRRTPRSVAAGTIWPAAGIPEPHVSWPQAPPSHPQASPKPTFCGRRHHPASRRHQRTPLKPL